MLIPLNHYRVECVSMLSIYYTEFRLNIFYIMPKGCFHLWKKNLKIRNNIKQSSDVAYIFISSEYALSIPCTANSMYFLECYSIPSLKIIQLGSYCDGHNFDYDDHRCLDENLVRNDHQWCCMNEETYMEPCDLRSLAPSILLYP